MSDHPVSRSSSRTEYQRQSLHDVERRRNAANRRTLWFATPLLGLGSYVLFTILVEALRSGIVSHPRRLVSTLVDVSVEPTYYWVIVLLVAVCAFLFLAVALGGLWILFRKTNSHVKSTVRESISDSNSKKL